MSKNCPFIEQAMTRMISGTHPRQKVVLVVPVKMMGELNPKKKMFVSYNNFH